MPRPRSISHEDALEAALRYFWQHGYDRSSVAELGEAIGMGPSSLYNAFGSKAQLFEKSLAHYLNTHAKFAEELLTEPSSDSASVLVRKLLRAGVKLYTTPGLPPGCAMLQGGGAGTPQDSQACAITQPLKKALEAAIRKALERLARRGETLPAPPRILATYVVASMHGLSQSACDGVSRRDLLQLADLAARAF